MVPFAKNIPVICGDVTINPNDIIVGDLDGVVIIPRKIISQVVKLLRDFDNRESKMLPIIKQEKSILKAIEKFNRY
jgi:regulator of RNase E activity RraA